MVITDGQHVVVRDHLEPVQGDTPTKDELQTMSDVDRKLLTIKKWVFIRGVGMITPDQLRHRLRRQPRGEQRTWGKVPRKS